MSLEQLARQGRFGDTMLAHINPQEAALLKSLGGSGTINPKTGLREYWGLSSLTRPFTDAINTIGDIGQGAIDTVSDVGSSIDDTVNDIVPGGWPTIAAMVAAYYGMPTTGAEGTGSGLSGFDMATADSVYGGATTPGWETALADASVPAVSASELAPVAGGGSSLLGGAGSALKYAGLASLLAGALSPKQVAMPGSGEQAPVGAYLSSDYKPDRYKPYAMGGLTALAAGGGPVERMSDANAIGANTGFPMADIQRGAYATPYQQPISQNVLSGTQDTRVDPFTGEERLAGGGLSNLGDYSDGGRLLRGPGDGVSDSIPAMIGGKQPARLADGEFVVPARIVSELGNGSTEAGARQLYAMMDRIQKARSKTVGKNKVAANTKAAKHLPA